MDGVLPYAARTGRRLRACLERAGAEARADGAPEIATHHLLTGLLAEGVAAAVLERLDVHADAIRAASHHLFGPPTGVPAAEDPPMSTEATCALDAAAHRAAVSTPTGSDPEVRTEHLLAALALDPGGRARRVLNHLGVDVAAIKRELHDHTKVNPARPAHWWELRPPVQHACSFCGRSSPGGDGLVNGPGVAICGSCIALAADILHNRRPTRHDCI